MNILLICLNSPSLSSRWPCLFDGKLQDTGPVHPSLAAPVTRSCFQRIISYLGYLFALACYLFNEPCSPLGTALGSEGAVRNEEYVVSALRKLRALGGGGREAGREVCQADY